jgi:GNAT superfamily N-acetyltransferase
LFEQECGVFHFSGDDFVVLFHHEFDELDNDLFFVAVHDDVHDDGDGFFVHFGLLCMHYFHGFGVILNDFSEENHRIIADRTGVIFESFRNVGQDLNGKVTNFMKWNFNISHDNIDDVCNIGVG